MPYSFTRSQTEYAASLPQIGSDINTQYNYIQQTLKELIAAINGTDAGNDIDGDALHSYVGTGIDTRLTGLEAGSGIKNVTSIDAAFSVGAAGDRYLKMFYAGNTTAWAGLQYSNSSGLFLLTNNSSTLQIVRHANGVGNNDSATVGQVNTLFTTNAQPFARQCVLSGKLNASNQNNALTIGTGLNINVAATTTNLIVTAGNGFNANGDSHKMGTIAADTTVAMVDNATSYAYVDLSGGNPTLGSTILPWSDAETWSGAGNGALLTFEGFSGTSWTDTYGNTWNATIQGTTGALSASSPIHGTTSWVTTFTAGNLSWIDCTNVTLSVGYSWTLEFYVNFSAFGAADIPILSSQAAQVFSISTTSASKHLILTCNDGTSTAVTGATTLATGTLYHIAVTYDNAGTYKLYLNGVLEITNTKGQLTSTGFGLRIGSYVVQSSTKYTQMTFDDLRLTYRQVLYTGTFTPPSTQLTAQDSFYWFNRKRNIMQYGITGNWADKPAVFIGEADAASGALTAVREYARCGVADSDWISYTNAAAVNFASNMGTNNYEVEINALCVVAQGGYTFGQVVGPISTLISAEAEPIAFLKGTQTTSFWTGTNLEVPATGSTANTAMTPADFLIRLKCRRNY